VAQIGFVLRQLQTPSRNILCVRTDCVVLQASARLKQEAWRRAV